MLCERCQHELLTGDVNTPGVLTRADVDALPSLPLAEYLSIPNIPGVYFAINPEHVFYIGHSGVLAQRWRNHPYLERLQFESEARVAWIELADIVQRRMLEKAAIRHFRPRWNKGGDDFMHPFYVRQRIRQMYANGFGNQATR